MAKRKCTSRREYSWIVIIIYSLFNFFLSAINYSKTIHQLFIIIQPLSRVCVCVGRLFVWETVLRQVHSIRIHCSFFISANERNNLTYRFTPSKWRLLLLVVPANQAPPTEQRYISRLIIFEIAAMHAGLSSPPGVRGNEIENRGNKLTVWFASAQVKIDNKICTMVWLLTVSPAFIQIAVRCACIILFCSVQQIKQLHSNAKMPAMVFGVSSSG